MIYRRFLGVPSWEFKGPFAELERMKRQMDRLMEGWSATYQKPFAGVFPLINLTESKDCFFIRAELPSVVAGDLDIQATANSISVTGERKLPPENKEARPAEDQDLQGRPGGRRPPGGERCSRQSEARHDEIATFHWVHLSSGRTWTGCAADRRCG